MQVFFREYIFNRDWKRSAWEFKENTYLSLACLPTGRKATTFFLNPGLYWCENLYLASFFSWRWFTL